MNLENDVIMDLDNAAVRFTSDGNISVIDAIKAVGGFKNAWAVWEKMKTEHPEVLEHCENHSFQMQGPVPVVNSEGWDTISSVLFGYLPDF